jgi:DNA repair and recombination protein RAD54 and RAD54-like protein
VQEFLQLVEVVCCKMTEMQRNLYNHFLESKATARLMKVAEGGNPSKGGTKVLGAITALKKLCNHPKLIYDAVCGKNAKDPVDGFKGCEKFFLPGTSLCKECLLTLALL